MIMFTISIWKDKVFEFFRYVLFTLGILVFLVVVSICFYYSYRVCKTTFVLVPKLEQQVIQDSLKIVSLQDSLIHLTQRVDTVYLIITDEIRPELRFNAGAVDSLDAYTQVLNRRTAPLLHYRE
jgi:hypothetical protein